MFVYGCRRKPEQTSGNDINESNKTNTQAVKTVIHRKKRNSYSSSPLKQHQVPRPQYKRVKNEQPQKATHTTNTELLAWLKRIESIENGNEKTIALKELGQDIGSENFKNALALARTISDAAARRLIYKGIFEAQTEIDPMGALKIAATLSTKTIHDNDYTTALLIAIRGAAAIDPHTSLSYLDDIKSDRTKLRARTAIYTGWGKLDQNAALEAAAELSEKDQRQIVPAIFNGWAQVDVFSAINYANELETSSIKNMIIYNIANGFLEDKWEEYTFANTIESEVSQMPPVIQSRILATLYTRWATTSPDDAAEHYIANHKGPLTVRDRILNSIVREWAKTEPAQALKWAERTLDNDDDYVAMVKTITGSIRSKDPQKVATLLEELPFTFADDTAGATEVFNLLTTWVKKSPQEAISWASSLDNRQMKIIATKSIAATMTTQNNKDTFQWAESLQDPDMQAYAFSNIALNQSINNSKESYEWIERLPSGFIKVRTAAGYSLGALQRSRDQASAAQFKQQLSDDELNPAELINILENSNLPESTRNRMIELLEQ